MRPSYGRQWRNGWYEFLLYLLSWIELVINTVFVCNAVCFQRLAASIQGQVDASFRPADTQSV